VAALVEVDPAYLVPDETSSTLGPLLDALEAGDPVPTIQQILGAFDTPAWSPALRTWQLHRVAGMPHHVLRQAFKSQVTGLALHSHSAPYLARRKCPVLSFYADPARAAAEVALFTDDRSRTVAWEGAGHWLHQERPAEFNAVVDTWLASVAAR
jgi:pimeloyl-ACP methyl ester carboxylesterase